MSTRSSSPDVASNREIESIHEKHQHKPYLNDGIEKANGGVTYENLTFNTITPFDDELNLSKYSSPFKWSQARKNGCLALSCAATWAAAYSAGAYSIASGPLQARFNVSSEAFQVGVTVWCLGFASSPMLLAPLSELSGRRPVFLFSGFMFFVALIGCAVTESFAGMLVARFFVGAGASTFATMVM